MRLRVNVFDNKNYDSSNAVIRNVDTDLK